MLSNISNAKSVTKSITFKKLTASYNSTVIATKEDSCLF
jgi:hypothetical protein